MLPTSSCIVVSLRSRDGARVILPVLRENTAGSAMPTPSSLFLSRPYSFRKVSSSPAMNSPKFSMVFTGAWYTLL